MKHEFTAKETRIINKLKTLKTREEYLKYRSTFPLEEWLNVDLMLHLTAHDGVDEYINNLDQYTLATLMLKRIGVKTC